jgi:hypothetical protein
MRSYKKLLLASTIIYAQSAAAQQKPVTASVAARGHWQFGVQLLSQQFNGLSPGSGANTQADLSDDNKLHFLGPQVLVGFACTPRLTVETGLGFSARQWRTKLQPSDIPEWWTLSKYQISSANWVVPLRVRYEFAQLVTGHLGCAVLAGVQFVQQNTRYRSEPLAAGPNPAETGWSIHRDLPLTLGLGLRYQVAPHWALTTEGLLNASTRFLIDGNGREANFTTPCVGGAVGLRYSL